MAAGPQTSCTLDLPDCESAPFEACEGKLVLLQTSQTQVSLELPWVLHSGCLILQFCGPLKYPSVTLLPRPATYPGLEIL